MDKQPQHEQILTMNENERGKSKYWLSFLSKILSIFDNLLTMLFCNWVLIDISLFFSGNVLKLYRKLEKKSRRNGANTSFSVKSKIFPKRKAQILQMRYQNVLVRRFRLYYWLWEKKIVKFSVYHHVFISQKL